MYDAPSGNSKTTVVPIIVPCAFSYFAIFARGKPTVSLVPLPEDEDGEEVEVDEVADGEEDVEDETNGFVSDDRDAADRSNVNCRMLSGPCWISVYVSLVESMALP
jgi:hypothetical protein